MKEKKCTLFTMAYKKDIFSSTINRYIKFYSYYLVFFSIHHYQYHFIGQ